MNKKRLLIYLSIVFLIFIIIDLIGLIKEKENNKVIGELCYEDGNCYPLREKCISEIIYYVPYNYTGKFEMSIDVTDICYDTETDPLDYKERVDKLFEEHPDDWFEYLDTLPDYEKDPIISVVETDTDLIYYEKIYGYDRYE